MKILCNKLCVLCNRLLPVFGVNIDYTKIVKQFINNVFPTLYEITACEIQPIEHLVKKSYSKQSIKDRLNTLLQETQLFITKYNWKIEQYITKNNYSKKIVTLFDNAFKQLGCYMLINNMHTKYDELLSKLENNVLFEFIKNKAKQHVIKQERQDTITYNASNKNTISNINNCNNNLNYNNNSISSSQNVNYNTNNNTYQHYNNIRSQNNSSSYNSNNVIQNNNMNYNNFNSNMNMNNKMPNNNQFNHYNYNSNMNNFNENMSNYNYNNNMYNSNNFGL